MTTVQDGPSTVLPTRTRRTGAANAVTLVRAVLTVVIAGLVVWSWQTPVSRTLVVSLASVALVTDLVDGRVARALDQATAFGAAFDMETDAFLILVLSGYAVPLVGPWVLLIGAARYLLLLAGAAWPWLTAATTLASSRTSRHAASATSWSGSTIPVTGAHSSVSERRTSRISSPTGPGRSTMLVTPVRNRGARPICLRRSTMKGGIGTGVLAARRVVSTFPHRPGNAHTTQRIRDGGANRDR